jgi:membrane-bound metal-dependent hydrolase YbcI (DUF457 family)
MGASMFVGHLALGLVAKRVEPKISLGAWMLAVMLADLLCFAFLIAGIEHFDVEPEVARNRFVAFNFVHNIFFAYSHSLLMNAIWAALFAAAYFLRRRYARGAWLLFAAVLSHWLLDFIAHNPDMQLAPGASAVYGLGLWNSIPATLIIEGGFWLLAIVLYVRATHPKKRAAHYAFWPVIAFLTLLWYGNIKRGIDPDPVRAGIGGLIIFSLVVAWAYWMNRLRPAQEEIIHDLENISQGERKS